MRLVIILVMLHLSSLCASCEQIVGQKPQMVEDVFLQEGDGVKIDVWVQNLSIPWSLVFLPDGRTLVSERPGTIRLIRDGKVSPKPYAKLEVAHTGEGGLMGIAAHPSFRERRYIYAVHSYRKGSGVVNRVVRLRDRGDEAVFDKVIIDDIPGGRVHDGGRIAFGPDGMLYITTGDASESDRAQDLKSLAGKILRLTPEGGIPEDNPFPGSPIYSYGHRNPQGIAWQAGQLFASEHGPSGEFGRFGHDEINIITKGRNYGWPRIIGAARQKGLADPLIVWKTATPPSGMTFCKGSLLSHLKGDLFVATLRSEALVRIRLKAGAVSRIERWFATDSESGKYGRIRDVAEGPDGALYFLTNNTDGRGSPQKGDDKIYRIVPGK